MMKSTPLAPVRTMIRPTQGLAVAIALLAVLSPASEAQDAPPAPIRVTLVARAPSQFPSASARGQRTEVVRHAERTPQNVVFVDQNATPEDLAGALALLQALRIQNGDELQSDFRARPEMVRTRPSWAQSPYRNWIIQQLVRLRSAAPSAHGDLGVVTAVQITLPAAKGTVTARARP
jgi:hypothetical protein